MKSRRENMKVTDLTRAYLAAYRDLKHAGRDTKQMIKDAKAENDKPRSN